MTTTPDARALADDLDRAPLEYGWSSHRPELGGDLCKRSAAALRALAGAQERAEKAEARVRELEVVLRWYETLSAHVGAIGPNGASALVVLKRDGGARARAALGEGGE